MVITNPSSGGASGKPQGPHPVAQEKSVVGSGPTTMHLRPFAKGANNVAFPMPIPILVSDFEDVQKSKKETRKEATSANVETDVHSNTTSLSTLPFLSARHRVRDLALISPFEICYPARLLGRLIADARSNSDGQLIVC